MTKLYLLLAFTAFAVLACSDDKKEPSREDYCKETPKPKECLIGKWRLNEIVNAEDCPEGTKSETLILELTKKDTSCDDFNYDGCYSFHNDAEVPPEGQWKLDGNTIKINCIIGDCNAYIPYPVSPEFKVEKNGAELKVTATGYSSFSGCVLKNKELTEVFRYIGSN